jgi:ectoine hydroxylase-related dioxygenase (phytanoyl-CoA dioxygenase family)
MEKLYYTIESHPVQVNVEGDFKFGTEGVLSNKENDIVHDQTWYQDGFTISPLFTHEEFASVKNGLKDCVERIIRQELSIDTNGFSLETYHLFVRNTEDHFKVVRRTRDLFAKDFNFNIEELIPKFEKLLGFQLHDIDNFLGHKVHIIIRINRPGSTDYNPPHKDIYEGYDDDNYIAQFLNFWIPIAGVTNKSSLPIAPKSHLIPESQIERTFLGGKVEGNQYRVRMIKSWAGSNHLERAKVKDGDLLMFSSHLIHGLAINEEMDQTRVALEFRLFKKNQ